MNNKNERLALAILIIFFGVGVTGHIIPATFPWMIALTPWVLLVAGVFIFWWEARFQRSAFIWWAAGTYVVTLVLEIIGVLTGFVFGAYEYGPTLGIGIMDVPLVIGFNWMIVVLGCVSFTTSLLRSRHAAVVVAALLAVVFDIFLEPVAISLDYWTWDGGSIPLQNYIAWFVISLVAAFAYERAGLKQKTRVPAVYALIQLVFFVALRLSPAV